MITMRLLLFPLVWSLLLLGVLLGYPWIAQLSGPPAATEIASTLTPPGSIKPKLPPIAPGPRTSLDYAQFAEQVGSRAVGAQPILDRIEEQVLKRLNEERSKNKANPLQSDDRLLMTARAHSYDMLQRNFFNHVTPEGLTWADRVAGVHRRLVGTSGENIWKQDGGALNDPNQITNAAMDTLLRSPGHRDNILRPEFTHVGIGVAAEGNRIRLTQVFANARTFLQTPLPLQIHRGKPLDLRTSGGTGQASDVGFFDPKQGLRIYGPVSTTTDFMSAPTGLYRLQFYFPQGNNYKIIYFGPDIQLE